ncbi:hypothetical protein Zmor_025430 [Zophobas morio]|uniref:thioredoxin-dependent peroxiredoxin n=1 Tax=Zophobas morio TaxID=2755281 RepID=A0AA38M4J7_9CUCU|nr:hypothetical protein Zmor_025430 [Zophobas morio]
MNYEKEQEELNRLWQECLSDEDDNEPFEDSGDEFVPESSDDSSNDEPISKKLKFVKEPIPSTSRDTPDSVLDTINDVIERCMEEGSDEDNANEHCDNTNELTWEDVSGRNLKLFPFTEINVGVKEEIYAEYYDKGPYEFFKLFLTDELISMMVIETNRYATQCKASATLPKARIREWHDTNCEEMESFIGTLVWMGLCPFSSIEAYWSKCVVYTNKIKDIMSRNRFQLLLKSWHFHNNEILTEDRLQKITPLTNLLIKNFQNVVIPKEHMLTKQEQNPGDKQPPQSKFANIDHFAFMMTSCDENLQNDTPDSVVFILDSGATDHMVNRDDVFTSWSVLSPPLQVAVAKTGEFMTATKRGLIHVTTTLGFTGTLQDVLFTPQATTNLLSIRRIQESGMKVVFDQGVQVQDKTGKTILTEDEAKEACLDLFPEKSMKRYELTYKLFKEWCTDKGTTIVSESLLLAYFLEKSKKFKAPSSLWCEYSMLKSTLFINENVDISKYPKLRAFLKRKNDGYRPKKASVFTREEISLFLEGAPDDMYLLMKVVMIIGIAGACRGQELREMKLTDVEETDEIIFVKIPNLKNGMPPLDERYDDFKKLNAEVIGCSIDSHFSHLGWMNTKRAEGGLGKLRYPLLSDIHKTISRDYEVLLENEGVALRGLFIIDPNGILRQITVNDLPIGRSVDETLRLIEAIQFVEKHGEVCPANWQKGSKTIKPDPKGSKEYFSAVNK